MPVGDGAVRVLITPDRHLATRGAPHTANEIALDGATVFDPLTAGRGFVQGRQFGELLGVELICEACQSATLSGIVLLSRHRVRIKSRLMTACHQANSFRARCRTCSRLSIRPCNFRKSKVVAGRRPRALVPKIKDLGLTRWSAVTNLSERNSLWL
jgi:hypothetical protein